MDNDDIAALFTAFVGLLIFALAWWSDRENAKITEELRSHHLKVTAIRRETPPAERRPPSQSSPK